MKLLITGGSGFVSRNFLHHLETGAVEAEVLAVARDAPDFAVDGFRHVRCRFQLLDLLDKAALGEALRGFRPSHILHLAAYSSVGLSWRQPVESFANNTNILLNLLEQVRLLGWPCRVLSVGSSEQYGNVDPAALPLREDAPLQPVSPYAVSRVAQELLSQVYVQGYGLDVVLTRSFNHVGPHQRDAFVVASLARQLVEIQRRGAAPRLVTGDRAIIRDFVDVRDVVRAYHDLLLRGSSGRVYNVCSGRGASIGEVIEILQRTLGLRVELVTDPQLVRPSDNRAIIGSFDRIREEIGWTPRHSLEESLEAVLCDWEARVGQGRA